MSWEGYVQVICINGHYSTADGYGDYPEKCPDCGAAVAETNLVDETNGCEGNPCQCGAKAVVEVEPPVYETCSLGYSHIKEEGKYKLGEPEKHGIEAFEETHDEQES